MGKLSDLWLVQIENGETTDTVEVPDDIDIGECTECGLFYAEPPGYVCSNCGHPVKKINNNKEIA